MKFKLIVALTNDEKTDTVIEAARGAGATGATVITSVRGEGLKPERTFLGLDLTAKRDVVLIIVAETKAREILECIAEAGRFDTEPGAGTAFQLAIEDAIGFKTQFPVLRHEIEDEL